MATRKPAAKKRPTTRSASTRTTSNAKTVTTPVKQAAEKVAAVTEEAVVVVENKTARTGLFSDFPASAVVAEFVGTILLVSFATVVQDTPLYLFFGLIAIVTLMAQFSGPHLNPAITIGAWLTRVITGRRALFYIIAQILGGFAAFGILSLLNAGASHADPYTGATTAGTLYSLTALTGSNQWYIFAAELIGAIILGLGVASAYVVRRSPLVKGFAYGGAFLVAAQIAYASGIFGVINPITAGVQQAYSHIDWAHFNLVPVLVYIIAPIIGSILGFGLYRVLRRNNEVVVEQNI